MGQQSALNLRRINVRPAPNNYVFRPSSEEQEPLFIETTKIAGVKPAIVIGIAVCFRILVEPGGLAFFTVPN